MRKIKYLLLAGLVILGELSVGGENAVATTRCDDVKVIFARGSGESLGDVSMTEWQKQLQYQLGNAKTLKYSFYELGSHAQDGPNGTAQYPATAVAGSVEGVMNLVGAAVSGGDAFRFGKSVDAGMRELKNYIATTSARCPATKFVLGGYSQGAMVVSQSLPALAANKILYAATFGDPKLYLPEGKGLFPAACAGQELSEYRRDVADCRAYEGVLGSQQPYQPKDWVGKVGIWCNKSDVMCSSKWSIDDHVSYVGDGMYAEAAQYIAELLQKAYPNLITINWRTTNSTKNDVVFLVDSTGSMANLIDQYRDEAKRLAKRALNSGGRVALFEFRDLDDPFEHVMHCDLSCDYQTFSKKLGQITLGGGGDRYESVLSAMLYAMEKVDWQDGANKTMIILTDGGYLLPDRDGTTLRQVAQKSLAIDPVNAYFVTSSEAKQRYVRITAGTGGGVFDLEDPGRESTETLLERPVAKLRQTTYTVPKYTTVKFDASESYSLKGDAKSQEGLKFDWDFEGDGYFDKLDAGSVVENKYYGSFSGFAQVQVTDGRGLHSTMSARVIVQEQDTSAAPATIQINSAEPIVAGATQVQFTTDAKRVLISVDDAILGYAEITSPSAPQTLNLADLADEAKLSLIPYNANEEKGTATTITLAGEGLPIEDNAQGPVDNDAQNNNPHDNHPNPDNGGSSKDPGAGSESDQNNHKDYNDNSNKNDNKKITNQNSAQTTTNSEPTDTKRKPLLVPNAGVGPR